MTMGTAIVARTKVRNTGFIGRSHPPRARLMTVSVGNTQSQTMRANWCFVGGAVRGGAAVVVGAGVLGLGMVDLLGWGVGSWVRWVLCVTWWRASGSRNEAPGTRNLGPLDS